MISFLSLLMLFIFCFLVSMIIDSTVMAEYVILVAKQLKWAWDFLFLHSLFQHRRQLIGCGGAVGIGNFEDHIDVRRWSEEPVECAVCLCRIEKQDEVRELRCSHAFHRVCLDRWLGHKHNTCPLCRDRIARPRMFSELGEEMVVLNLLAGSSSDRLTWWLR